MIEGEAEGYSAALDSQVYKQGSKSLLLTLNNGAIYSYLMLPGKDVAGKTVAAEGFVKINGSDSVKLMLAFRDPAGKTVSSPPIIAIQEKWIRIGHEMPVPKEYASDRFAFCEEKINVMKIVANHCNFN